MAISGNGFSEITWCCTSLSYIAPAECTEQENVLILMKNGRALCSSACLYRKFDIRLSRCHQLRCIIRVARFAIHDEARPLPSKNTSPPYSTKYSLRFLSFKLQLIGVRGCKKISISCWTINSHSLDDLHSLKINYAYARMGSMTTRFSRIERRRRKLVEKIVAVFLFFFFFYRVRWIFVFSQFFVTLSPEVQRRFISVSVDRSSLQSSRKIFLDKEWDEIKKWDIGKYLFDFAFNRNSWARCALCFFSSGYRWKI